MEKNEEAVMSRLARGLQYLSIDGETVRAPPPCTARTDRVRCDTKEVFDQVVHAANCQSRDCNAEKFCNTIKRFFRHDTLCIIGPDENCYSCRLMWHLSKLHGRQCQESSNCTVPHCRNFKLRRTYDSVVHAAECQTPLCKSINCMKVKELIQHGMMCEIHAAGGCDTCFRMWHVLKYHARACEESNCYVLHCRDLKEYLSGKQQQSDSQEGASVACSS